MSDPPPARRGMYYSPSEKERVSISHISSKEYVIAKAKRERTEAYQLQAAAQAEAQAAQLGQAFSSRYGKKPDWYDPKLPNFQKPDSWNWHMLQKYHGWKQVKMGGKKSATHDGSKYCPPKGREGVYKTNGIEGRDWFGSMSAVVDYLKTCARRKEAFPSMSDIQQQHGGGGQAGGGGGIKGAAETKTNGGAGGRRAGGKEGMSVFSLAKLGDVAVLQIFLESNKALVNSVYQGGEEENEEEEEALLGCTPLFFAARAGQVECLRWLVGKGANVKHLDPKGCSLYHHAAATDQAEVISTLLATVAATALSAGAVDKTEMGFTPLHVCVHYNTARALTALLRSPEVLSKINVCDLQHGNTPFSLACAMNHTQAAVLLLQAGCDYLKQDKNTQQPILKAYFRHDFDLIENLLVVGGLSLACAYEPRGKHSLACFAARDGQIELLHRLHRQVNLLKMDERSRCGFCIGHHAAESSNTLAIEWLAVDLPSLPPSPAASTSDHIATSFSLLTASAKFYTGLTPLHIAASLGQRPHVEAIMTAYGASSLPSGRSSLLQARDNYQYTVLDSAACRPKVFALRGMFLHVKAVEMEEYVDGGKRGVSPSAVALLAPRHKEKLGVVQYLLKDWGWFYKAHYGNDKHEASQLLRWMRDKDIVTSPEVRDVVVPFLEHAMVNPPAPLPAHYPTTTPASASNSGSGYRAPPPLPPLQSQPGQRTAAAAAPAPAPPPPPPPSPPVQHQQQQQQQQNFFLPHPSSFDEEDEELARAMEASRIEAEERARRAAEATERELRDMMEVMRLSKEEVYANYGYAPPPSPPPPSPPPAPPAPPAHHRESSGSVNSEYSASSPSLPPSLPSLVPAGPNQRERKKAKRAAEEAAAAAAAAATSGTAIATPASVGPPSLPRSPARPRATSTSSGGGEGGEGGGSSHARRNEVLTRQQQMQARIAEVRARRNGANKGAAAAAAALPAPAAVAVATARAPMVAENGAGRVGGAGARAAAAVAGKGKGGKPQHREQQSSTSSFSVLADDSDSEDEGGREEEEAEVAQLHQEQQRLQQQQAMRFSSPRASPQAGPLSPYKSRAPSQLSAGAGGKGGREGGHGPAASPVDETKFETAHAMPPDDLCCPISLCLMLDPCVATDGHTYDRSFIEGWISQCEAEKKPLTSPLTGKEMVDVVIPNINVRQRAEAWIEANPEAWAIMRDEMRERGWHVA